jgi:tRNA 5-methylaminomethyl-2-thiouridine biosynthesis bifunctional protein
MMQSPELEVDSDGAVRSKRFDDIYASKSGAYAQAQHVYVQGVGLPERWQAHAHHTILELGFGLGVNFLSTYIHWLNDANRCTHLDYIGIEAFPIAPSDWEKIRSQYRLAGPQGEALFDELSAAWPDAEPGFHTLTFAGGRVRLILVFWDVLKALVEIEARVDSVYLDGFSPAKNPEMFSKPVLTAVRRLLKPHARLASYSVQSQLRSELTELGFEVRRLAGFAHKKERLAAELSSARRVFQAPPVQRVAIIGGGIVGLSLAHAAAAHFDVQVFESASDIGAGASGVPAALIHPPSGAHDSLEYGLQMHAFRACTRALTHLRSSGFDTGFSPIVIHEQRKNGRTAQHHQGGMIVPSKLLAALRTSAAFQLNFNANISGLRAHGEGHAIQISQGDWQEFDAVILCNGIGAQQLMRINLRPVAGQVEMLASKLLPALSVAHCGQANILPLRTDLWCVGNSFERGEIAKTPNMATRTTLLANAAEVLHQPDLRTLSDYCQSWVGTRVQTPERKPLIGMVRPGLYLNLAHASKGFMTGFLAAEILCNTLLNRAQNTPARLLDAVSVS